MLVVNLIIFKSRKMKFNIRVISFFIRILILNIITINTQAIEGNGIVCLASADKAGHDIKPKFYFFKKEAVQKFNFKEVIKKEAILASEKSIILRKPENFKFRTPRPNYIYWQEGRQTMIYNVSTNLLKVKVLDKKITVLECRNPINKTRFYGQMLKWKKLYNMKLESNFSENN